MQGAIDFARASSSTRALLAYKLKQAAVFELALAADVAARATREPTKRQALFIAARRLEACAVSFQAHLTTPVGEPTRLEISHRRACRRKAICPLCARWAARRLVKRFAEGARAIIAKHPGVIWVMVTLTIPNEELHELGYQLQRLDRARAKLMRTKRVADVVLGALSSTEIAIRRDRTTGLPTAGSHIHALWALRPDYFDTAKNFYVSQDELTQAWSRCCQAPHAGKYIVDIRRVRDRGGDTGDAAIVGALREVVKYQVKHASVVRMTEHGLVADPSVVAAILSATFRRHQVRASGILLKTRTECVHTEGDCSS